MLTPSGPAESCGPASVTCAEQPAASSATTHAMPIDVRMPRMLRAEIRSHRGSPPDERRLRRGLRDRAVDPRVETDVVQRPRDDRDEHGAELGAVDLVVAGEIAALVGREHADEQPD